MNLQQCRVGVHQPNFAPWLGYFYKIYLSDKFVFLDNVAIELNSQQAFVNRTKIKAASGAAWLTCPVSRKLSPSRLIIDTVFEPGDNWRKKVVKTIFFTYKKAAYFDETYALMESLVDRDIQELTAYNIDIIKAVCDHIGIRTSFFRASEMNLEAEEKSARLVEICKKLDGSHYLSGKGGLEYHDVDLFTNNGLAVVDLKFVQPTYPQLYGGFEGGLSIIDVLFNCGKVQTLDLLQAVANSNQTNRSAPE